MPNKLPAGHGEGRRSPLEKLERVRRSPLEQLERVLNDSAGELLVQRGALQRAQGRARVAIEAAAGNRGETALALLAYAGDVLVAHAIELAADKPQLRRLIERIETDVSIPRVSLAREVLTAPQLLQLPSAVAVEVELGLLLTLSEAQAASLWAMGAKGELEHIADAGAFDPDRPRTRQLANRLLGDHEGGSERVHEVAGVLIARWQRRDAALIVRGKAAAASARRPMLESAAPMLGAMLEREELLARGSRAEEGAVASAERRLARLRYDLHDGPQQDVILLAEDIQLLRTQLEAVINGRPNKRRVLGRLDDLQARLVALDGELRRIVAFVQSPFMQDEPLPEVLAKLTDEFAARTGIEPETRLEGDFTGLTDCQQITLLSLIRESLSNIREHSEAEHVTITLSAGADGVEATVIDDGQGFVPEAMLIQAARAGHLGLVGMHERVHLLGGRTQIDSRPGGPTVISARLPPYPAIASA